MKVALVFRAGTRPHCCRATGQLQLSLQDAPSEKSAGYKMHRVQVMHSALPAPVCYALYKTSLACTERQPDILKQQYVVCTSAKPSSSIKGMSRGVICMHLAREA